MGIGLRLEGMPMAGVGAGRAIWEIWGTRGGMELKYGGLLFSVKICCGCGHHHLAFNA